jgi:hypothetical protein
MSAKSELEKIEKRIHLKDEVKINVSVNFRDDDLLEWHLEDGSVELITRDEFERRGGILISCNDEVVK